jgi:PAS domain S-box-containing protein
MPERFTPSTPEPPRQPAREFAHPVLARAADLLEQTAALSPVIPPGSTHEIRPGFGTDPSLSHGACVRILIVDDTPAIHADFRKILVPECGSPLDAVEASLFGDTPLAAPTSRFELDSAYQGQEALGRVQSAVVDRKPYALAFVDVRMPPGWDGIETITRLWETDPDLQIVVATAYSDYSWTEILKRFGARDNLLVLKKPFDNVEVLQLAHALSRKWQLARQSRDRLGDLDRVIAQRTEQLNEAARHILRLNRLYSCLSKSNELAARTRSLDHLCQQACRIAVEDGSFRVAWVGMLAADGVTLTPFAYYGCSADYLKLVRISVNEGTPEGRGPAAAAFREGRYSICNTAREDPRLEAWREVISKFQVRSVGAFPLQVKERTVGVLVLYSTEVGFFNDDEIKLLDQLSADLSFALELVDQDRQLHLQGAALESAANSIVITDPQGLILWSNAAFTKMSGYTPDEIKGSPTSLLKSGKHEPEFYRDLWRTISSGQVWQGEVINRRKDGALYTEEMTITPVRGDNGRIANFIAIKQDITERKRAEEALRLTQEQLRQSQKLEAIGQLAGGVAHDFNNLLAIIRGNTELALMAPERFTPEQSECLAQVVTASERAADLTRQLLAFGRKQLMQARPLDLNEVVRNLTKMLQRIIGEHIELRCSCAPSLPPVMGDPGMIEQVLVNLVVNARDAMPSGGQLTISTQENIFDSLYAHAHAEARAGRFVVLSVQDTGTGIAPEILPRVFEPFFTTKEVGKGTGLGLATVYGIIKQHQGWVDAYSRPDSGSTFTLYLPVHESPVKAPDRSVNHAEPLRGSESILLVEDEEPVRKLTRRVLETFGYHVVEAASGREALELPSSQLAQMQLLLTDVIMPGGITGRELAERLTGQYPSLQVVFTSGYSGEVLGHDTEIMQRNKVRFLAKPCSPRQILTAIRNCLDQAWPASG